MAKRLAGDGYRVALFSPEDDRAATATARRLADEGYEVEVYGSGEDEQAVDTWTVEASHETVVSAEAIAELRAALTEVAAPYGGYYDGWGALSNR